VHFLILNGPNLNMLGVRRPEIYGTASLSELEHLCRSWAAELGVTVETVQSNHEGVLIDTLHSTIDRYDGVVLNPGALTHYSYALHDAIEAIPVPVVEVHISDISTREEWRRVSVVSGACVATIAGEGIDGYRQALVLLTGGLEP
jgi:3-dehydroquinate dehydratase-2